MRSATAALVLTLTTAVGLPGQPTGPAPLERGSASVGGRVTDDLGKPIAGASVTLDEPTRRQQATAKTGPDGTYRFERIPDGKYSLYARKGGYVSFWPGDGVTMPPYVAMTSVVPDQRRDDVNLVLPREGRIHGRVIDRERQAVAGVSVGAGRMAREKFIRTTIVFRVSAGQGGGTPQMDGVTGPDGVYEVGGLPAGDLLVEARPSPVSNRLAAVEYETAFHPDVASLELAAPVSVEAGRVTTAIDIVMTGHALTVLRMRVSPEPNALTDLQVNVVAFPGRQIRSVMLADDGLAQVQRLREGRYAVWARGRSAEGMVAVFTMLDFRRDQPELLLTLETAGRITGRVIAARGGVPPVDGLRIESALSYDGEQVGPQAVDHVEVAPDGRFGLEGQFGERRVSLAGIPAGWTLRQIVMGRQDVTHAPVPVPPGATVSIEIVVDRR